MLYKLQSDAEPQHKDVPAVRQTLVLCAFNLGGGKHVLRNMPTSLHASDHHICHHICAYVCLVCLQFMVMYQLLLSLMCCVDFFMDGSSISLAQVGCVRFVYAA